MSKCNRSFTIDKEISKELDNIKIKAENKGAMWLKENIGFTEINASTLVENFIFEGIKEINRILKNA